MKKWIFAACVAMIGCASFGLVAAQQRTAKEQESAQWLERLQTAVRDMGDYALSFDLSSEGYTVSGTCRVAGENYYIALPEGKVYCDGTARYEVNDRTREVVIDRVDAQANNLLDNPVRAFDWVDSQYTIEEVKSASSERVTLCLKPREKRSEGVVRLSLDRKTALPTEVIYGEGKSAFRITIHSFKKNQEALPSFQATDYPGYELIDFR